MAKKRSARGMCGDGSQCYRAPAAGRRILNFERAEEQYLGVLTGTKIALGAGSFWGVEQMLLKEFAKSPSHKGIIKSTTVGFMSPYDGAPSVLAHPTFEQVCTGATGHIEVVLVEFDGSKLENLIELMRFYFQIHDPTLKYRQGNDRGFQYASWVFCENSVQKQIVRGVRKHLQTAMSCGSLEGVYAEDNICTKVSQMRTFVAAEDFHQKFYATFSEYRCDHRLHFREWPAVDISMIDFEEEEIENTFCRDEEQGCATTSSRSDDEDSSLDSISLILGRSFCDPPQGGDDKDIAQVAKNEIGKAATPHITRSGSGLFGRPRIAKANRFWLLTPRTPR